MKNLTGLGIAALLVLAAPAPAVIGTIDNVPAATLLLPYFEVDLDNAQGVNTLFSINNADSAAVLAKVVVWSDQGVPALNFNVYLTGYDVETISMRDVLVNGNIPRTASDGQDPADTISPQGELSQDINFASCSQLPYGNPVISSSFRAHLQAWFTGNESPATHNCAGAKLNTGGGSRIARGYITVDTVNRCDLFFPGDWGNYGPSLTDQNVLWGDWFIVNPGQNFAQGDMLVHIESCLSCFTSGDHTFYGRYNNASADDSREALPTTWASRFLNGGPFDGGASFLVWREGNSSTAAYSCAQQGPAWYPLQTTEIVAFNESEEPVFPDSDDDFPNQTQRIDSDVLGAPFSFGWAYLNLQHSALNGSYGDDDAQSWVIVVMDANGRYSVGFDVLQLDNANDPAGPLVN